MRRREFIAFLGRAVAGLLASGAGGQTRIPKVGVLAFGYPDPSAFLTGLRDGLHHLGYEEGRSVELIIRSAGGKLSTFRILSPAMASP